MKNRLVVVLGMHRSGTSAITKSLELMGVGLGANLYPAGLDNPKGFWEDQDCIDINDALLKHLGSAYDRLGLAWDEIQADSIVDDLKFRAVQHISDKLTQNNGLWGFKDPRTCRLLDFWNDVFSKLECDISFVLAIRNPASVVASLHLRNSIPSEKAYFLWLQHVIPSLSFTKSNQRVVVDYDEFLANPYQQLLRISSSLALSIPKKDNSLIIDFESNFLDQDLRHTRFTEHDLALDKHAPKIVLDAYSLLKKLANDDLSLESTDLQLALDGINNRLTDISIAFDYINKLEDERLRLWESNFERDNQIANLNQSIVERDSQIANFNQVVIERDRQIDSLSQSAVDRDNQIANLNQSIVERDSQIANLNQSIVERDSQIAKFKLNLKCILDSTCWKITKPLRLIKEIYINKIMSIMRKLISDTAREIWVNLPLSTQFKQTYKHKLFSHFASLFKWSQAYRSWHALNGTSENAYIPPAHPASQNTLKQPINEYVPLLNALPPKEVPVRLIAFYLPQFHAIDENNEWWGDGFTEWTNVKPAQAQFEGHYQPHLPNELGYYNLLDSATQHRQIELAKLHGVGGFCFYSYWFNGKLLLEKPTENYLNVKSLDLPFCLCWANENWSRRWDGLDSEILIGQNYSEEDDLAFIQYIAQYMKDERYIRIDGKPLLLVYRPSLLPSAKETAKRWRDWCIQNGIGEIYLAYTQSFEAVNPNKYGFDAAIEFPPNNSSPPNVTDTVKPLNDNFGSTVYDWNVFVERSKSYQKPAYQLFRSVCPSWDNTARRKNKGTVFINSSPKGYQEWLTNAVEETCTRINNLDERLVFVNAWNEWAEGAHLEPDQRYGYAYLEATRKALINQSSEKLSKKIIVVSHDAHPHGAQFLALGMVRSLKQDIHLEVEVVLLGKGRLASDFAALAPVHDLSDVDVGNTYVTQLAQSLAQRGFTRAIVNTTVSGVLIPILAEAGIESICLVHELPGVIQSHKLEKHAKQIAASAKAVVFPAQIVADGFSQFATVEPNKLFVRPQGLYRRNKWRFEKQTARTKLRKQLGLSDDTKIVLTVGYADHRKGVDLFIECALKILSSRTDVDFVWVGHWEQFMQSEIESKLLRNPYSNRIHFVGHQSETALFYAASDVYALTSREDPFPSVVLESFDVAIPVIAFAGTGGCVDLIKDVGGIIVEQENIDEFSHAICQLVDDPEVSAKIGNTAQSYIDQHFSFRSYLFDLCEILGINLPKISVIVPNYNYAHYIEQRLDSICKQSVPIFELIILDDASTDQSVSKISDWLSITGTEAKVTLNQTNSGNVFSQWQKGLSKAKGDYVWIAEADDLSDDDFLETTLPPLSSSDAVISYCESKQINSHGMIQAQNYHEYLSFVSPHKWKSAYVENGADECKTTLAILNTIPNVSAVVFERNAICKVFNEYSNEILQYKKAGDWIVYLRTLAYGDIAFSPRTANLHRRHEGSVIGGSGLQTLLKEIIEVQEVVASKYNVSTSVYQKAQEYRLIISK